MKSLTLESLALAAALWLIFVGGLFVGRIVLPGKMHRGQPLRDGSRREYKLNGLLLLIVLALILGAGQFLHLFSLASVNRLFWPLLVVANICPSP